MKKKIICAFMIILLIFEAFFNEKIVAAKNESTFEGERTIMFVIDRSDMENFINGGRSKLDLIIRSCLPQGVSSRLSASDRDILLKLQFSFNSLEEYKYQLRCLLGYEPFIIYEDGEDLLLIEEYPLMDLFNFIRPELVKQNCLREKELEELFSIRENSIQLRGEEYSFDTAISIGNKEKNAVLFNSVVMETSQDKNGGYQRVIRVELEEDDGSVYKSFKKLGKTSKETQENGYTTIELEIDAANEEELVALTRACLDVNYLIYEQAVHKENLKFSVERVEYLDLESLLTENGYFCQKWVYPEYMEEVSLEGEAYWEQIGELEEEAEESIEKKAVFSNSSKMKISYVRDFCFDNIDILTEFPSAFGKVTRKIVMSTSVAVAAPCHEEIAEYLTKRLGKGMELNMYDKEGQRFYEITYSAWNFKEIKKMTSQLLGISYTAEFKQSLLPYGKESLTEKVDFSKLVPGDVPAKKLSISYKLSAFNNYAGDNMDKDGAITFSASMKEKTSIEYGRFSVIRTVIEALILLLLGGGITIFVKKHGRKKN